MYLACIGILWNRSMFLVIPSGSGDFAARMNAFPLLYRYGSVGNLYGSGFFPAQDTDWFQSFPGTMKSVRDTASTIRCDFRSDAVGKTADPSGTEWNASHFPSILVDSGGRNHRPAPFETGFKMILLSHINELSSRVELFEF